MPGFNGSGTFVRTHSWITDRNNGVKIVADRHDAEDDAFATGLSSCIVKDGQTTTTARIPFAFGIGVADGSVGAPALNFTSDTDCGLYRIGANNLGVAVNGAKVLDIATTGLSVTGTVTSSGAHVPSANDGAALGSASLSWADLFLASGAVINFNNGNVTVTHSSGLLTVSNGLTVSGTATMNTLASSGATITGGTINNAAIGGSTPAAGAFTTLSTTGALTYGGVTLSNAVTGTGNMVLSASPTFTGTATIPVVSLTGGQIAFPATQSASADANTLDDYEEGTWTPVLSFGGATTGITYSTQSGTYTKIGNRVLVDMRILLSNKGSATGAVAIGGLPFTAGVSFGTNPGYVDAITPGAGIMLQLSIEAGGTSISVRGFNQSTGADAAVDQTIFANNSLIRIAFQYRV